MHDKVNRGYYNFLQACRLSTGQSPHLRKALETELVLGGAIFSNSSTNILSDVVLEPPHTEQSHYRQLRK